MPTQILLLEDDPFLRDGITELLTREGCRVTAAATIRQAQSCLSGGAFSLAIFDVLLPDGNGLDLCRMLRANGSAMPILCLTACDEESDIVAGLDAGADDYVTKPFPTRVLLARVRALLRRSEQKAMDTGDLCIDFDTMTVRRSGETVYITPTEFQILRCLVENNGVLDVPFGDSTIHIYGYMLWFSLLYSAVGTALAHIVGRKLISLNYEQQRFELG